MFCYYAFNSFITKYNKFIRTQYNIMYTIYSGGPLNAIFRWEVPLRSNGVVRGYEAQCWTEPPSACADASLSPLHTQLVLTDLANASTYFFQVKKIN